MPTFAAPDYSIARLFIERGLAAIYLIAFLVAARQFPALLGERGLLPAPDFLAAVPFGRAPSLFYLRYSDRLLVALALVGAIVAAGLLVGVLEALPLPVTMLAWALLWLLYLSIVNVGQAFYAFGWESLLLEAGFLGIFLGNDATMPSFLVIVLFRWLAFRVEFGAGLIKLRGDACWRDLSCMDYHHETQPMPNPLSWYFHHLPRPVHRFEAFANFVAQLVLPFGLFLPQPVATVAAALMIGSQMYLVVSGNYAWLNWLTIVALAAGLSDGVIRAVLPGVAAASYPAAPPWYGLVVLALTVLVAFLSYWPVRNLAGEQVMNASFNPLHLVNTYGAFGSVSRERYEIVLEGTADGEPTPKSEWREYEFKGKPGDPRRLPPQVAPYHLRLDWLMWFIPLSPIYAGEWFRPFLARLLRGDRAALGLLRANPFPDGPPAYLRALAYRYRFTTWRERRESGAWWSRELVGEFLAPVRLSERAPAGERTAPAAPTTPRAPGRPG